MTNLTQLKSISLLILLLFLRIKTTIGAVVEPMKVTEEVEEFMRKSRRQVEIKKKRRQKR